MKKVESKDFSSMEKRENTNHPDSYLEEFRDKIKSLTYQESLIEINLLLDKLQSDTLQVEDLKEYYLKGTIYLEHCERLLNNVEKEVTILDLESIK